MSKHDLKNAYGAPTPQFHAAVCRTLRSLPESHAAPKMRVRRVALVACAACLLLGVSAFAAGRIVSRVGHSSWNDAVYSYDEAVKLGEGCQPNMKPIETFSSGYTLTSAMPGHTQALDEDGNVVEQGDDLIVNYEKDGEKFSLYLAPVSSEEGGHLPSATSLEYNGVTLHLSHVTYVIVPPDYQLTEEEKAAEERGEAMYAVNGDTQRSEYTSYIVDWQQNDTACTLIADSNSGATLDENALAELAKELIDANR